MRSSCTPAAGISGAALSTSTSDSLLCRRHLLTPGSVRALALHPALPLLASVGLDRHLRLHSTTSRACLAKLYLKTQLSDVAFCPTDASMLPPPPRAEAAEEAAEGEERRRRKKDKKRRGGGDVAAAAGEEEGAAAVDEEQQQRRQRRHGSSGGSGGGGKKKHKKSRRQGAD